MPHEAVYCDVCRKNLATFSLLQDVDGHTVRRRLCRDCATREGSGLAWLQAIEDQAGEFPQDGTPLPEELNALIEAELATDPNSDPGLDDFDGFDNEELQELFDVLDELDDEFLEEENDQESLLEELETDNALANTPKNHSPNKTDDLLLPEIYSKRCPKCDTTWDRLREDGRAGCAYCYEAFEGKLLEVMNKMQRGSQHVGKVPVTRLKRRLRLEHLRKQRDHRLQMLQNRLKEAVAAENYEDAAALRDKIKMVEATIVDDRS